MIAGNRTHRLALVSANCLGQHSPAIAEVDTAYERMWARNAAAMYAYADASAAAVTLTRSPRRRETAGRRPEAGR